ncbi:YibE/F family protein [bacterium]|nr:YibE/F family protein [bacterium]
MKKFKIFFLILLAFLFFSFSVNISLAQDLVEENNILDNKAIEIEASNTQIKEDIIFKARVIKIIEEEEKELDNGKKILQQKIELKGLEGDFLNREIVFNGIGDLEVLNSHEYKKGDKVLVAASYTEAGEENFYIVDYVRLGAILWLAIIFLVALVLVGRGKGFRSILSLVLTFLVIIKFIIPQILKGSSPIVVTLIGSIFILFLVIYITEKFKPKAHLAVLSIFVSLFLTVILSTVFVNLVNLNGASGEEILFLFNLNGASINLKGLLLAGIIIGSLGALDDIVISQIATCKEIKSSNNNLSNKELFKKTYRVGVSHIASMTNTLFLAYAGASLPLLMLFVSGESVFNSFSDAINTELLATEIVRTLAGSIGIVLSVPISTFVATWFYGKKKSFELKD